MNGSASDPFEEQERLTVAHRSEDGTRGATLSRCGAYRYALWRRWEFGDHLVIPDLMVFVMLNPSTADHRDDDPTIRRCMSFARREGKGGLLVLNLFALRSKDPRALDSHPDPFGPWNARAFDEITLFDRVVVAWGGDKAATREAIQRVLPQSAESPLSVTPNRRLWCLGTNADGSPKHPLYLASKAALVEWRPPWE